MRTLATALFVLAAFPALAQTSLPDPIYTPGAINPAVTQQTIRSTICIAGWTATIRPPVAYTSRLKKQQLRQLGYANQSMADYEEDHLIPLALGGAPTNASNLWPQPRFSPDGWTAGRKDVLELVLVKRVCHGLLPLSEAQSAIARNWIAAYKQYVTTGVAAP